MQINIAEVKVYRTTYNVLSDLCWDCIFFMSDTRVITTMKKKTKRKILFKASMLLQNIFIN